MSDLISFIIPIKIDSPDRVRNLDIIIRYLVKHYKGSQVIISECDKEQKVAADLKQLPVDYIFTERDRFSKAYAINNALSKCTKEIVCIWDADMIASPFAMTYAIETIQKGFFKLVVPHNQIYINLKNEYQREFFSDIEAGVKKWTGVKKMKQEVHDANVDIFACHGGFIVTSTKLLIAVGGFNVNMISYGWEDTEILERYKIMGLIYCFADEYSAIHIDHIRGNDSKINEYYEVNKNEFFKVKKMSYNKLFNYISENLARWQAALKFSEGIFTHAKLVRTNAIARQLKLFLFFVKSINYKLSVFGAGYYIKDKFGSKK